MVFTPTTFDMTCHINTQRTNQKGKKEQNKQIGNSWYGKFPWPINSEKMLNQQSKSKNLNNVKMLFCPWPKLKSLGILSAEKDEEGMQAPDTAPKKAVAMTLF
jgi:hypothetical protein